MERMEDLPEPLLPIKRTFFFFFFAASDMSAARSAAGISERESIAEVDVD
jgi:hypothetical protein